MTRSTPSRPKLPSAASWQLGWSSHSSSRRLHFRSPVLRRTTPLPITFSFRRSLLALGSSFAFCSVALLRGEKCPLPGAMAGPTWTSHPPTPQRRIPRLEMRTRR